MRQVAGSFSQRLIRSRFLAMTLYASRAIQMNGGMRKIWRGLHGLSWQ